LNIEVQRPSDSREISTRRRVERDAVTMDTSRHRDSKRGLGASMQNMAVEAYELRELRTNNGSVF